MNIKSIFRIVAFALIALSFACETDDIEPNIIVSLSSDVVVISEAGGSATISANLNTKANTAVSVQLFVGGTAQENTDYTISSKTITIPEGSLAGTAVITSIQDSTEEGNQTIDIAISSANGADVSESESSVSITLEDDDVAPTAQIIVNEVLYDPPSGIAGDANGDGVRDPLDDEFIEFINVSSQAINLGGYMIYDADALASQTPRHIIPSNTIIPPNGALIVFGGGTPTGNFGGAVVQTATGGELNLSNSGDLMTFTDTVDMVVVTFDITPLSNNPDESYTRNPDITGDFEQHNTNTPLLFSPGTKIDGTPF